MRRATRINDKKYLIIDKEKVTTDNSSNYSRREV